MKLLVGCDPEIWIYNNKLGKIISAAGLFPGTKEEPFAVTHGAIQVDGMAAEYNILPAETQNQFVYYNLSVLCDLRDKIKELNPDLDFRFEFSPVADFGAEYIAEQPEEARRLGCTPDFNAWEGGAINPIPDAEAPFRTASGHFHLGWTKDQDINDPEFVEACCMMVKQLDSYVGKKIVNWENKLYPIEGVKRRELYGKAGAYRPKPYGVEYRTGSNVWLTNTTRMAAAYNQVRTAFNDLLASYRIYESHDTTARNEINTGVLRSFDRDYSVSYHDITMEGLDDMRDDWGDKCRWENEVGEDFDGAEFDAFEFIPADED